MATKIAERYHRSSRNSARSLSLTPEQESRMKRDYDIIMNFLNQKDVALWFRGTSNFQLAAADSLLNAIRDDTEQSTTHRVMECLGSIGIDPLTTDKDTRVIMRLSRGNDLAFLWFLMELHYKTSGSEYSVNEQLIMSSICHLDLITTIRELDRILPPGHPSKQVIEQLRRKKKRQERHQLAIKKRRAAFKGKEMMPYFEKQIHPRTYGKPLTLTMPDFKVKLGFYNKATNPNFVVPNEANRWYTDYKLQPGKRIANRIINDELYNIFDEVEKEKYDKIRILCEHHKVIEDIEKNLETELRLIAEEKCLNALKNSHKKEETKKRVMQQLEKDIDMYMSRFRKLTAQSRKENIVRLIGKNECGAYLIEGSDSEEEACRPKERVACIKAHDELENDEEGEDQQPQDRPEHNETECIGEQVNAEQKTRQEEEDDDCGGAKRVSKSSLHGEGDCAENGKATENDAREHRSCSVGDTQMKQTLKGRVSIMNTIRESETCDYKYISNYDYGHVDVTSPTTSQKYFLAPLDHRPYQFDYRKIFRFTEKTDKDDEKCDMKRMCAKVIDSEAQLKTVATVEEEAEEPNAKINEAIKNWTKRTWKTKVAKKRAEMEAEEKQNQKTPETLRKYPHGAYYDPDDKELMNDMLKDALEYMSANPKYVLASMPDAYKLPMLREWIWQRYGKTYTKEERYKSFRTSLKIFHALDKICIQVPMPNVSELGNQLFIDYSCRDYLLRKANHIKNRYYKRMDHAIMEQARVFWFAMRPYLCSNGPPRNTYFAYMPSRVADLTRFRPWKPNEYMDAKAEWERRNYERKMNKLL